MEIRDLAGHIASLLFGCAYLVKDILWLRSISIVGSMAAIVFFYIAPDTPLWTVIVWNFVFIGINAAHIGVLIKERSRIVFTDEESELYETIFKNLAPFEFMKLMRLGEWKSVEENSVLTVEGKPQSSVILLYNGFASVDAMGRNIANLRDGDFIGEMNYATKGYASATVTTTSACRLVEWPQENMRRLLTRNPTMRIATEAVLSADMARKLQRYSSD